MNIILLMMRAAEEKVSTSAMVKVSFELPAEYRSVDGKPIAYEIVRVYTDEDGNICTESVAYSMEGDIIKIYADNTSEYAILVAKDEVLAGDVYSGDNEGEAPLQLVKEPESRNWLWIIVLIAAITVISLGAGYIFYRKRRNDSKSDSI